MREGTTQATYRVTTTVENWPEALTWIVRQLDAHDLADPTAGFQSVTTYGPEAGSLERYYEVWVAGTVASAHLELEWP